MASLEFESNQTKHLEIHHVLMEYLVPVYQVQSIAFAQLQSWNQFVGGSSRLEHQA